MKIYHSNTGISISQILWTAARLLLFGGGVLAIRSHSNNLVDIARILKAVMMCSGFVSIIIYGLKGKEIHSSHWLFADGLTTMLLSLFPLFNQVILPVMIPFLCFAK